MKTKLEFTPTQLDALISLIETIEGTHGCSDIGFTSDGSDYDSETKRNIKNLDRMFKMNGYTINCNPQFN